MREYYKDKLNDWHAIRIVKTLFSASLAVVSAKKGYMSEGDVVKTVVNGGLVNWCIDAGIKFSMVIDTS